MTEGWREGTPDPASSQRSEEPPSSDAPLTGATPGELAGLVTPAAPPAPAWPAPNQLQAAVPAAAPSPPVKKGPAWRGIAIRVGVIAAIVIGALVLRDRLTGSVQDLRVGDCFDEPSGTPTEISEVQFRPCNEAHDGEIFFVEDYPSQAAYPGDTALEKFVTEKCIPGFETYVGRDYETDTEFDFAWLYPLPAGWTDGDHEISCYIVRVDKVKMTKSVKVAA